MSSRSTVGIDIISGGDVVTKTIALRYKHIKGWIEEQETIKVNEFLNDVLKIFGILDPLAPLSPVGTDLWY